MRSIYIPSQILDWYREDKIWAKDRRYSFCLWILWTKGTRIRIRSTWMHRDLHGTCTKHGKDTKTLCIASTKLAQQKGFKFYQTRSNAIILYDTLPANCIPNAVMMETGVIKIEKVYVSPRPPPKIFLKIIGWSNWIQKLLEVVETPNKSNQNQKPNYGETCEWATTWFSYEGNRKRCLVWLRKHKLKNGRDLWRVVPVSVERVDKESGQPTALCTQLEEIDIDFRVSGLPHAVVKQAENFRVHELLKKIESHPHRAALQADLQQNNVYDPFSDDSKAMIREIGNVEFFELCETIPKVQCSQCLLYWNQGVINCTCGHLLVESESSQNFNKLRLDALSIPHYVIKKGRCHGARHDKTEAQQEYCVAHNTRKRCLERNYNGIHDRFLRDPVLRDSQLKIGWTEQKCIEMDKLAQEDHSYRLSREEFLRYQKHWYLTLNKSGKNAPMRVRSDFRAAVTIMNRFHREIRRRTCRTYSFSPISKMAPFLLKWFMVELGHIQKLVELMSSIHFQKLFVAVGFVYSW